LQCNLLNSWLTFFHKKFFTFHYTMNSTNVHHFLLNHFPKHLQQKKKSHT